MDLNAMAVFVEVAQAGSFSTAASKLNMPLSTVSRKVAELEQSLNTKLLERTTRRMRLTETGARYYSACLPGLEVLKAAETEITQEQVKVSGALRISVPPNLADCIFVPVIGRFRKVYPDVRINVAVSERNLDFVDDEVDLSFRVGPMKDSPLIARKLVSYRHILVTSPAYIAEFGVPDHPSNLDQHKIVGFGLKKAQELHWTFTRISEEQAVTVQPDVSINDYAAIQAALRSGMGIGEIPSILCHEALAKRSLVEVLDGWRFPNIDLQAVHTGGKNQSRLVRLFLKACVRDIGPQLLNLN